MCSAAVEWVLGLGHELGLVFQDSKTVWLTTQIEFLGLKLDFVMMEACLPPDKLVFLKGLLQDWSVKCFAGLREVQELAGFLQFVSQVIPCSQAFLHCIIDFSMKFQSPFQRLHVTRGVKADLFWWWAFCMPWNGVCLLNLPIPSVIVHKDASGRKGIDGVCASRWFSSHMPCWYWDRDIQFKEVFAILYAILCWGNTWTNYHLTFYCDNQAVVLRQVGKQTFTEIRFESIQGSPKVSSKDACIDSTKGNNKLKYYHVTYGFIYWSKNE